MIAEYQVNSVTHFLETVEASVGGGVGWVYRGQTQSAWALLPKAGRREYFLKQYEGDHRSGPSDDLSRFAEWRKNAVALDRRVPNDDLECLGYAQHYGLATRLLDWTSNPLVALFFAVEADAGHEEEVGDEIEAGRKADAGHEGAVFAYHNVLTEIGPSADAAPLEKISHFALYRPRPIDRRILAQSGVFIYHPNPREPLEGSEINRHRGNSACADELHLVQFKVAANAKLEIARQLATIGFSRKTLFPDLDGLSTFTNWGTAMRKNPDFEKKAY